MKDQLELAGRQFDSRLIIGTGKFASGRDLAAAARASGTQIATLAIKRVDFQGQSDGIVAPLRELGITLMPNTSGARDAREAVYAARLAREALGTDWVKVEVHPDQKYLLPDPIETYAACEELVRDGFRVFAYCGADPVLCRRLAAAGVSAVMPLGAPIGSARGLETLPFLRIIIREAEVPVIIDAGIGTPSEAAHALELGADAVMVNTAIAAARSPLDMAAAFRLACEAGRSACLAGLAEQSTGRAVATSPLEQFLEEAMK